MYDVLADQRIVDFYSEHRELFCQHVRKQIMNPNSNYLSLSSVLSHTIRSILPPYAHSHEIQISGHTTYPTVPCAKMDLVKPAQTVKVSYNPYAINSYVYPSMSFVLINMSSNIMYTYAGYVLIKMQSRKLLVRD